MSAASRSGPWLQLELEAVLISSGEPAVALKMQFVEASEHGTDATGELLSARLPGGVPSVEQWVAGGRRSDEVRRIAGEDGGHYLRNRHVDLFADVRRDGSFASEPGPIAV
jgi:hypothetical protein